jgi:hypothetical protein
LAAHPTAARSVGREPGKFEIVRFSGFWATSHTECWVWPKKESRPIP